MASFKDILESTDDSIVDSYQITPTTIYDLYYIQMIWEKVGSEDKELLKGEILSIAQKYIHDFYILIYNQLIKYQNRKRIDRFFKLPTKVSPKSITPEQAQILKDAMEHTFRSDLVRRNLNWNSIADSFAELVLDFHVPDYQDIIIQIDKLNHAIHNTQTSVLDKLNYALVDALDDKANEDPEQYKKNVSINLKKIRLVENTALLKEDVSLDYDVPTNKEKQMMDFYMTTIFVPTKNEDINNTAKYFKTILYNFLQKELCDAVFYSLASEVYHVIGSSSGRDIPEILDKLEFNGYNPKLFKSYIIGMVGQDNAKLMQVYSKSKRFKPDDEKLKAETELDSVRSDYAMRYAAALYSIKKNNSSKKEFVEMCMFLFDPEEFSWSHLYGGVAWQRICKAWLKLDAAEGLEEQMIWIDHVYDMQHNTGTIFNKLKSYRGVDASGMVNHDWIKKALEYKKNLKEPKYLLKRVSPDMKRFALYYFKETEDYTVEGQPARKFDEEEILNLVKNTLGPDAVALAKEEINKPNAVVNDPTTVFSGIFEAGIFIGGTFEDGEWHSGIWLDGHWKGGEWRKGAWYKGEWDGGGWLAGTWYNGLWHAGEWKSGDWRNGTWENGVWVTGVHHSGVWKHGQWEYGRWNNGEWFDGEWMSGLWKNGVWLRGDWHGGTWEDGNWISGHWHDGNWSSGTWANGIWEKGNWWGGFWDGGEWHNGIWYNGKWQKGIWHKGIWKTGRWKDGTWEYGSWENGIWENGTWQDGIWTDGEWHGGDWITGTIFDPEKKTYVKSKVSPKEYFGNIYGYQGEKKRKP